MKNFNPLHFLCEGRLLSGMNENGHVWIERCNVAMVAALHLASLGSGFWAKMSPWKSKNKRIWFSGHFKHIQTNLHQSVDPLFYFIKITKRIFLVQIRGRVFTYIEVSKYHNIYLGKVICWSWVFKIYKANLKKFQDWPFWGLRHKD